MKLPKSVSLLLASLLLSVGAANAAQYSLSGLGDPTVARENPGFFDVTFNSLFSDSNATFDFVLKGFLSLDGKNSYMDKFKLTINETSYTGSFNLGGGGTSDATFGGVVAETVVNPGNGTSIPWDGGTTTVKGLAFNLKEGDNLFRFEYLASGSANNGGQGLRDEGWAVTSATVTAVPEVETYAMLLAGLGLMGTIVRRRKAQQA